MPRVSRNDLGHGSWLIEMVCAGGREVLQRSAGGRFAAIEISEAAPAASGSQAGDDLSADLHQLIVSSPDPPGVSIEAFTSNHVRAV